MKAKILRMEKVGDQWIMWVEAENNNPHGLVLKEPIEYEGDTITIKEGWYKEKLKELGKMGR